MTVTVALLEGEGRVAKWCGATLGGQRENREGQRVGRQAEGDRVMCQKEATAWKVAVGQG